LPQSGGQDAEIAATEGYDSRMSQLNDNIYVMADLIQEYM
jgi:hypothetical protein